MYKSVNSFQIIFPYSDVCFLLHTDSRLLVYKLNLYYGEIFSEDKKENAPYNILQIAYINNELYFLEKDNYTYNTSSDNIDLIVSKILRYIRNNVQFKKDYLSYHASCVEIDGKTIMLTGGTSSGKTTLTAFLSTRPNAKVISEDITILDCLEGRVVPLYRPLFLRTNSCKLLSKEYGISFFDLENITYSGSERVVIKNHPRAEKEEYKLTAIIFLQLDETNLKITQTQEFNELLENSYSNNNFFKNVCNSILISKKIPMFKLNYYNLRDTYEIIKSIK